MSSTGTDVIVLGRLSVYQGQQYLTTSDTVTLPTGTNIRVNGQSETLQNDVILSPIILINYIESNPDGSGEWGYIGVDSFPINDCAKVAGVFECYHTANETVQFMGYLVDSGYHESLSVLGSYNATSQKMNITPRRTTYTGAVDNTGVVAQNISGNKWYCEAVPLNEPLGAIALGLFAARSVGTTSNGTIPTYTWRQNTGTTSMPRLYSLTFYDANDNALYDFRPCKVVRTTDEYGLYDIVNKKLYFNTNPNGGIISGG